MTTKNYGPAVSGYLNPDGRAWETVVFEAGKPVLDKELNLDQDLDIGAGQTALMRAMPSGWLSNDFLDTSLHASAIFTASPTALRWNGPAMAAHVNGWLINITNTGVAASNRLTLSAGPVGPGAKRTDLVILEVWRKLLSASPSTDGKSPLGRIWANGNVKVPPASDAALNFPDDILDINVGSESTKRVQIQYRLRVVSGVDIFSFPDGIDDPAVTAQSTPPNAATPDGNATLFTYTSQSTNGDAGLWRAGDGVPTNTLNTVDGYMYAIPLCSIFRRNASPFAKNTNHNGGVATPGPSDRPDGLFQDVVVVEDVADLRHGVSPNAWSYAEVLEKNLNLLLDNDARNEWFLTSIGGGTTGHTFLYANEVGVLPGDGVVTGDTPGAQFIAQFDGVRRFLTDRINFETVTVKINAPGGGWVGGSTVTIQPTAMEIYPYAPADFAARAPADVTLVDISDARWIGAPGGNSASAMTHIASITGLGVRPVNAVTITLDTVGLPTLLSEPLYVDLIVAYSGGNNATGAGLTFTPTSDFGVQSYQVNNPVQLPVGAPVSFDPANFTVITGVTYLNQPSNTAFDYPHREIRLAYTTVSLLITQAADTTGPSRIITLPERLDTSKPFTVQKNAGPALLGVTFSFDGRTLTVAVPDASVPGDTWTVTYQALRPLPNNGEQLTLWYTARAPQMIRGQILGTTMTVLPRHIASSLLTMTVGSGSPNEAYPFPFQYVQMPGVYPTSTGTFGGEHELDADANIDVAIFNSFTGLLKLPVLLPYVPQPQAVTFTRAPTDADAELRSFFKTVPVGYIPNAYAQSLSDPKKHRDILPVLMEIPADSTIGRKGQLLLVLIQRWAIMDDINSVAFEADLTENTTTASVYRVKGHLMNKR